MHNTSSELIRSFVGRIESLENEKTSLVQDISEIYAEAKSEGLNVKALRAVIARRKKDADALAAMEADIELYLSALGALDGTPLGRAAVERELGAEARA